jgi:hypothetical protein
VKEIITSIITNIIATMIVETGRRIVKRMNERGQKSEVGR